MLTGPGATGFFAFQQGCWEKSRRDFNRAALRRRTFACHRRILRCVSLSALSLRTFGSRRKHQADGAPFGSPLPELSRRYFASRAFPDGFDADSAGHDRGRHVRARRHRLLGDASPRHSCRGSFGAGIHHPARLRTRLILQIPRSQRLGRSRHERADARRLRTMAARTCPASCLKRQPRPARFWRHRYADRSRISGVEPASEAPLQDLSPPHRSVFYRCASLLSTDPAHTLAARRIAARVVAKRHGPQPCHRHLLRAVVLCFRSGQGAEHLRAHGGDRRRSRRLAVLHSTSIRRHSLGKSQWLGLPSRGFAWFLVL